MSVQVDQSVIYTKHTSLCPHALCFVRCCTNCFLQFSSWETAKVWDYLKCILVLTVPLTRIIHLKNIEDSVEVDYFLLVISLSKLCSSFFASCRICKFSFPDDKDLLYLSSSNSGIFDVLHRASFVPFSSSKCIQVLAGCVVHVLMSPWTIQTQTAWPCDEGPQQQQRSSA